MAYSASLSSAVFFHGSPNPIPRLSPTLTRPSRQLRLPTPAALPPPLSTVAGDIDGTSIAVIGGGSVAALAAVFSLADPERRRKLQAVEVGGDDKEVVKEYFNNSGFQRWKKIYGETEDVNTVQKDIRLGHSKTVENVMKMLLDEGPIGGITVCDAGCGTGCLSIPLAKEGAIVSASDISAAMVAEAQAKAKEQLAGKDVMPKFEVRDLESLDGKYDTVICLDVLIHYPQRELFPGPSKATRAYLHAEADVERALNKVGWKIRKRGLITTQFYFARLVEAVPA
ncbi:hypothetical protein FNV43_RR06043 [Rhamnella rubrinervis]|uniref:Methyltransferase domain-containing protein n=1 Tax=Rhamnella rubrinervis TaxID=2594499 RepID=A0A8K0HD41_9ROSA|nr:hypothetical protein FNV43_RR06043 [Rhamnella rubrinervis]